MISWEREKKCTRKLDSNTISMKPRRKRKKQIEDSWDLESEARAQAKLR